MHIRPNGLKARLSMVTINCSASNRQRRLAAAFLAPFDCDARVRVRGPEQPGLFATFDTPRGQGRAGVILAGGVPVTNGPAWQHFGMAMKSADTLFP